MEWSWFPVQLSITVALTATVITFILGLTAAYGVATRRIKGKAVIETIFFMPLVLPPTVIGFILIVVFGMNSPVGQWVEWMTGRSLLFTATAATIAATVVAFPLMYQSIKTGFLSVDQQVVDAAMVDGASEGKLLTHIILPLSHRSIITGVILSFTRAFGEFGATLMFAGNIPGVTQTIPTSIYLALETGETRIAWYYALISIGISFLLLLSINRTKGSS
ncbi:molybdate ABC transporter permease subunit [Bacillus sp. KH172YL63]|uniref:molybdate ABC transporter permease subunit n=1 Tax=Bacillus sp. KH172YL63 TaxID=2709784 RepID=UPI0013E5125E|nr:molybdate ABC transporter permease subunit [Bacillus sp. KH172YL63]BCB02487.1 putative molybdenum transport system permease protein YvgM [Bacillus sp. KH172YL63]